MYKKHIVPDECVETLGIYQLKLLFNPEHNQWKLAYRNEDKSEEGMFNIAREKAIDLFPDSGKPIYIMAYIDLKGSLQVFPDVGFEEQNWT